MWIKEDEQEEPRREEEEWKRKSFLSITLFGHSSNIVVFALFHPLFSVPHFPYFNLITKVEGEIFGNELVLARSLSLSLSFIFFRLFLWMVRWMMEGKGKKETKKGESLRRTRTPSREREGGKRRGWEERRKNGKKEGLVWTGSTGFLVNELWDESIGLVQCWWRKKVVEGKERRAMLVQDRCFFFGMRRERARGMVCNNAKTTLTPANYARENERK